MLIEKAFEFRSIHEGINKIETDKQNCEDEQTNNIFFEPYRLILWQTLNSKRFHCRKQITAASGRAPRRFNATEPQGKLPKQSRLVLIYS